LSQDIRTDGLRKSFKLNFTKSGLYYKVYIDLYITIIISLIRVESPIVKNTYSNL